jgi:hypothetical protein
MTNSSLGYIGSNSRFDNIHGSQQGSLRYPSPFFDIGHTYLPTSVKQMFRWCRYYFLTNPIINAVTYKMAEYPITPIQVEEPDSELREKWTDLIENGLQLRGTLIEVGLDYFCYGNAFVTIHWPIEKYLICGNCKKSHKACDAVYKFRNFHFYLACDKCQTTTEAKVHDQTIKSLKGVRIVRWNPEHITVEHNEITGKTDYFFEIPVSVRNDIMMGKRHIIENIPHEFITSLRESKSLRFLDGQMYHLKRPTIAQKDQGWGMPIILPVLKDTYYLQILRKAQESIAQQYIVPLRVLFPQGGSSTSDPYSTIDLSLWRARIEGEIEKWRMDQNYIPILPIPIGNETIGGEGKALMLHQEMRAWSEQIVAGMHVPIEFIFGGLSYSGSSVSMRMLENQFLGYRTKLLVFCRDFILKGIANFMDWVPPKISFERFRMADDLQRAALILQANQAMKVSDTTFLRELDLDVVQEEKYKASELSKQLDNQRKMQLANAQMQGEIAIVTARYQAAAARVMAAAGMPTGMPPNPGGFGSSAGGASMDGDAMMLGDTIPGQSADGGQAAAGMPAGATAYEENAHAAPAEGLPVEVMSPLNMMQGGNNMNVLYLARRAATQLGKMDPMERQLSVMDMRASNPQLHKLVLQIMTSEQGSQEDNLNPMQKPMPDQKPPRRKVSLG